MTGEGGPTDAPSPGPHASARASSAGAPSLSSLSSSSSSSPPSPPPGRVGRWWLVGPALALIAAALALINQGDIGVARDEVVYMAAGERYADWWGDLVTGDPAAASRARIEATFGGAPGSANNPEHPPLWKTLFGLSERVLHRGLAVTDRITAHRVPAALAFGAWVWLAFAFGARYWGARTGAVAGGALLLMPRGLFHAGLAVFDLPVAMLWLACVYAYARALEAPRWSWGLGLAFGLLLATKHNALILPVALACHYLAVTAHLAWARPAGALPHRPDATFARRWWDETRFLRPGAWLAMATLGPLVLVALWPWLWLGPVDHVGDWIAFHLRHVHYNYEYLGRNWNAPPFPWHVPLVTTALVVPVATLSAAFVGAVHLVAAARRKARADERRAPVYPGLLLLLSAGAAMGPFLLRTTPIFGAEKHWMAAFATLAVFAGVGVASAARAAAGALRRGDPRWQAAAMAILAALVLAAAGVETGRAQPYALSHYNALAGGAPGGADLGMNRQFWGYAARGVLPWLREHARGPDGGPARVYTHDASPAWPVYQRDGLVGASIVDSGREGVGVARSDYALVIHERHFNRHDFMVWREYGTVAPVFVLTHQGVPIVSVYRRPRTDDSD